MHIGSPAIHMLKGTEGTVPDIQELPLQENDPAYVPDSLGEPADPTEDAGNISLLQICDCEWIV